MSLLCIYSCLHWHIISRAGTTTASRTLLGMCMQCLCLYILTAHRRVPMLLPFVWDLFRIHSVCFFGEGSLSGIPNRESVAQQDAVNVLLLVPPSRLFRSVTAIRWVHSRGLCWLYIMVFQELWSIPSHGFNLQSQSAFVLHVPYDCLGMIPLFLTVAVQCTW